MVNNGTRAEDHHFQDGQLGNGNLPPWSHCTHPCLLPSCRLGLIDLIRGRESASNLVEKHSALGDDVGAEDLDEGVRLFHREPDSLLS